VLTFELVDPFEEVVLEAELRLSEVDSLFWILFLSLSNSEIFLSKLSVAETADSLSASKELNEAANWLKAASSGRDEDEDGVEGLLEKSRRELMGLDELEFNLP
jgi:hypothetical protein